MRRVSHIVVLLLSGCQAMGSGSAGCGPAGCGPSDCQQFEQQCCEQNCCGPRSWCGLKVRHAKYLRCWDNLLTRESARCAAKASLHGQDGNCKHNTDYREGYQQAFIDVALGGSGGTPAVPPPFYWEVCARSPGGHQRAQNWFSGYSAGASQALGYYGQYNKVATSGAPGYPPIGAEYGGNFQTSYETGYPGGYGVPPVMSAPPDGYAP